ncbi:hemolysin family protein [Paenibacillus sp. LHD-117]|uniref:hemolysin family protein n=1 Tax=Paenibacillus sp. LHD-117 TaxID=3071412 RepID=UPI0027E044AB|nr:hemolysin family protein [Paenibacillus sp. LHD-117]MDQ6421611.1 hemolysin family protein [Paenibacillus sp. LHD-117]
MILKLVSFALLLAFTAFFVATEFAIIRMRASRVQQMVDEGVKNAKAIQHVTMHLDGYLSACQLGITITALGLGWLGEPTVEELLHPLFYRFGIEGNVGTLLSFLISFVLVTYLHVVLGELAPKTVAIIQPERISQLTAPAIILFHKMTYPFIWLLNGSANKLVRLFGLRPASEHEAHSEEEIRHILSESYESGKINKSEFGYVSRIFDFDERLAREIMVPRTDMVCIFVGQTREENIEIIKREQYTRYPVADGDKDNIIGVLNTKHLFLHDHEDEPELKKLLQPVTAVPDAMPVSKLMSIMQLERVHMVILLDEYGGTSGLLTMEDIVEEIVGEIRDEFDADETKEIERLEDEHYLVDGKALISDVNDISGMQLPSGDADTIGGWLYQQQPALPEGEAWNYRNAKFIVRERDDHRIRKIEIFTDIVENEMSEYGHA